MSNPVIALGPPGSGVQTPVSGGGTPDHIKIAAPLQGTVSMKVSEGSLLKAGDVIAVQISAKTELEVKTPRAGYIRRVVPDGTSLNENGQIAVLEVV
ncbi:hypothetical protein ACEPAI_3828 [Sanghuangporus weigelae]